MGSLAKEVQLGHLAKMTSASFSDRFSEYFKSDVSARAAKSLGDGAEIEFHVTESDKVIVETFTFTRSQKANLIKAGPADHPQMIFKMTPLAADEILADTTSDIGKIGVNILKLMVSTDANKRVSFQIKAGFTTLFSKGYFGVITAGGSAFSAFLATKGLNGMGAIKTVLGKMK